MRPRRSFRGAVWLSLAVLLGVVATSCGEQAEEPVEEPSPVAIEESITSRCFPGEHCISEPAAFAMFDSWRKVSP